MSRTHMYLVVGAGGTGSYFYPKLLNYLVSTSRSTNNEIMLVDGDVVEEKNLLRQGFYTSELGKGKAEALYNMYKHYSTHLKLGYSNSYIDTVQDVLNYCVNKEYSGITIVSCVDNNMARLRLTVAVYFLQDILGVPVSFVDSGNTEWTGQVLATHLTASGTTYLKGLSEKVGKVVTGVGNGTLTVADLKNFIDFTKNEPTGSSIYSSIFTQMGTLTESLTRADYELSCDDVVVSSPQNIGTNMMASTLLLLRIQTMSTYQGGEYLFNARDNHIEEVGTGERTSESYETKLDEILDYMKSPEGFGELFISSSHIDSSNHQFIYGKVYNELQNPTTREEVGLPSSIETPELTPEELSQILGEEPEETVETSTPDAGSLQEMLSQVDNIGDGHEEVEEEEDQTTQELPTEENTDFIATDLAVRSTTLDDIVSNVLTAPDTVGEDVLPFHQELDVDAIIEQMFEEENSNSEQGDPVDFDINDFLK